jgi:CDP-paratose 2-epimerase
MRTLLVTGSSGLIGSTVVGHFHGRGWTVHGVDNNLRAEFFGPPGDTRWNQRRLLEHCQRFSHHELDVRDRQGVQNLLDTIRPDAIVHAAAQPSHELAASRPFDDFDVNAVGTLNLLEAARRIVPQSPLVHLSSNKVYGDAPNRIPLRELPSRWDYADAAFAEGIPESMSIDHSLHSLYGASKVSADILVQEYGRYFGMPTCCLRTSCVTGPAHAGVQLHGFLSYLVRTNLAGAIYNIYGYGGKQVRDHIHACDVARFVEEFIKAPRPGEVYNCGGGRANSCSILEAFERVSAVTGKTLKHTYVDEARRGDHLCYISDTRKMRRDYPHWSVTKSLDDCIREIADAWRARL